MSETNNFRAITPEYHDVKPYQLMRHTFFTLDNGIKVYALRQGVEPIISIQFVFKAGKFYSENYLLPEFAARLLTEGTMKKSSTELAERLAYYAASFHTQVGSDFIVADLTCLTKHASEILPLVREIFHEAIYAEKEVQLFKDRIVQSHKTNLEKISFLALNTFREKIFSKEHPYGFWVDNPNMFAEVERDDVVEFYRSHLQEAYFDVFISGNFDERTVSALNNNMGKFAVRPAKAPNIKAAPVFQPEKLVIERANSSQTCIRMGMPSISPQHEDYFSFMVLNEVLGGYFGSRLMRNIREDKGYTYGIHSNFSVLRHGSIFSISSEVNKEFREATYNEILKEMAILCEEKVASKELDLVKNSMVGGYVSSITTPFDVMEKIRTMVLNNFPLDFYDTFINHVRATTSEDLQNIAQKYFKNEMLTVMVG